MFVVRSSKLSRLMSCAGFAHFKDLEETEAGPAAKEGTAFAELVEKKIKGQPIGTHASNGVPFDEDMHFHAHPIVEETLSNCSELEVETQIAWGAGLYAQVQGQYDAKFIRDGKLYIDDWKYGFGIVEVEENWQLLAYAIGECVKRQEWRDCVLRIRQPRAHHEHGDCRAWEVSAEELSKYHQKICERLDAIAKGYNQLTTGPQCKYCPAAGAACPAFNRLYHDTLEVTRSFTQDNLNEQQLAGQLDQVRRAMEILKIKSDSLEDLAKLRIASGKVIPGYMTENKYGHRQWGPNMTPTAILAMTGIDITSQKILSPAQAEKLGMPKDFVKMVTTQPFIGQKLVKKDAGSAGDKIFGTEAPKMVGT